MSPQKKEDKDAINIIKKIFAVAVPVLVTMVFIMIVSFLFNSCAF